MPGIDIDALKTLAILAVLLIVLAATKIGEKEKNSDVISGDRDEDLNQHLRSTMALFK